MDLPSFYFSYSQPILNLGLYHRSVGSTHNVGFYLYEIMVPKSTVWIMNFFTLSIFPPAVWTVWINISSHCPPTVEIKNSVIHTSGWQCEQCGKREVYISFNYMYIYPISIYTFCPQNRKSAHAPQCSHCRFPPFFTLIFFYSFL